jgi:hypothetical protein
MAAEFPDCRKLHFCLQDSIENSRFSGHFGVKSALFRAKKGQNRGFAVTDSTTGRKCKLLIYCKLQAMERPKKRFSQGGGVGGRSLFASRRPKFEPISQSTKRMGNNLQAPTVRPKARFSLAWWFAFSHVG